MDEKPKSIWKKSWTGPRAFLFWLLVVSVAAFLTAALTAAVTSVRTTLFDRHSGLGNFVGYTLFVMFWFIVAVAVAFILYGIVRWLFCWRNLKRSLFVLACFVTLIALFYAEEDWRGWHVWQKFKREWEAKGEHFDFASVVPPPVPDDQNFAMTPIVASSYLYILDKNGHRINPPNTNVVNRLGMTLYSDDDWKNSPTNGYWAKGTKTDLNAWQRYYRLVAAKTNLFRVPAQPQSPADDVLVALSKYDSAIEELREASRLPSSRFPLNYDSESPSAILLPHLAALKKCAQTLQLRSLAELQSGQPEKALADVRLALQLTDKIRTEPFLISHLVRIAMLQIMLQPVWEGLAEHKWSEAQLVALDAELAKFNFPADYKLSMRGEMGCQGGEVDRVRRHPEQLEGLSGMIDREAGVINQLLPGKFIARLIPTGWFYQNQFRCARMMVDYCLPVADVDHGTFSPALARIGDAALKAETKTAGPFNVLERLMLPGLGNGARRFAYAQSSVNLACTAIALERYRLAHDEYPDSLDTLVPQFIAKLPHDVINDQPLHYRRTSDGQFVLYSVGWNETDDGGEVGLTKKGYLDISTGDWVWRYPAK
jgi:tetratricopeptide (TPR) repeat protein